MKRILLALLLSGGCFCLSLGLSDPQWWAFWLAPVPILFLAHQLRPLTLFLLAFTARLIGYLSWYSYLSGFLPIPVTIGFISILPLLFALLILLTRRLFLRFSTRPVAAALIYPVLYTSLEFLLFLFSRDGTFGSIAYTQYNFLPLIQLASLTGLPGITFVVSLTASALALALYYRKQNKPFRNILAAAAVPLLLVLGYGELRLAQHPSGSPQFVGMIAYPYHSPREKYWNGISGLARQGATVILLPEKVINATDSTASAIQQALKDSARQLKITIIAGVTRVYPDHPKCEAWVFTPDGNQPLAYQKVKLFEGETLEGFTPGKDPGFFRLPGTLSGVAICKDLDFERYILRYGEQNADILWVPAWDFNKDGWLHSRMAMMRAIELGCPMVRNALAGRMTITDSRGRVLGEASSEGDRQASLVGSVIPGSTPTLYKQWGDWFGWLNLIALLGIISALLTRRGSKPFSGQ